MKNFKYIVTFTAVLVAATGCKKSFLEQNPDGATLTQAQEAAATKQDPTLLAGRVAGLYSTMYQDFVGQSSSTVQNHDDFGQKAIDIYSDMLSQDMVLGATIYGWYRTFAQNTATKANTGREDYSAWRYYYKIIFSANTIIDVLGGNDVVLTDANLKHYMGQAKAMRAYAYFYLANLYSLNGYGTGTDKILPVYTSTSVINAPAKTNAEVYNLIISDLTSAVSLLSDFTRAGKGQIDADVAKGLLAYAYAARGTTADLGQVVTLTDQILAKYPLTTASQAVGQFNFADRNHEGTLLNADAGFNNLATPSWIWGADITLSSGLDLVSWWGQMDIYTYSYAWAGDPKFVDSGLYATYTNGTAATNPHFNDIRKGQFFDNAPPYDLVNGTHVPYGGLLPQGKFFNEGREEGGQRNITDDYIYMRSDEMQLLNAEANCKLGNAAPAKTSLAKLMVLRYSATDYPAYATYLATLTGSTLGSSLFEEIYLQTRLELWGEGKTYLAMKRNQHSATRGSNHLFFAGTSFTYNSPDVTFPVPSAEVLNNPNLNN